MSLTALSIWEVLDLFIDCQNVLCVRVDIICESGFNDCHSCNNIFHIPKISAVVSEFLRCFAKIVKDKNLSGRIATLCSGMIFLASLAHS